MRKFIKATLVFEGVKEDETWSSEYLKPIQDFIDSYDRKTIEIEDVGLDKDDHLVFIVSLYGDTRKEVEAMYTLFKRDCKNILKSYGLTKIVESLKAYGETFK